MDYGKTERAQVPKNDDVHEIALDLVGNLLGQFTPIETAKIITRSKEILHEKYEQEVGECEMELEGRRKLLSEIHKALLPEMKEQIITPR